MKIYPIDELNIVPKNKGIYFLYSNDELIYIGRSKNIQRRIKQHLHESCAFKMIVDPLAIKRFSFLSYDKIIMKDVDELIKFDEQQLIDIIPTKFNGCKNWVMNNQSKNTIEDVENKIMEVDL